MSIIPILRGVFSFDVVLLQNLFYFFDEGEVYTNDISLDEALRLASFQILEAFIGHYFLEENVNSNDGSGSRPRSFRFPSKISLKQIE